MPDNGDAPGPAQEFLSGTTTHVGHICVVDREAKDPLQLSAPQYVLLPVHQDREVLILPLLDGVGAGGNSAHLPKLCNSAVIQTVLQLQLVHPRSTQRPVHAWQVSPEVSGTVSSRDLDSVNHHRVTLQESRDVPLVIDAHGDHVLKHPEERPVLPFFRLGLTQQAVKLKEQPPCAFIEPFPGGIDDGQIIAGTSSDHQVKRTPLLKILLGDVPDIMDVLDLSFMSDNAH